MASVSASYLELAGLSKAEFAAVFAAGTPPDVSVLIGFEYRGFNQPKATALLGIRKFIKAFYLDHSGRPFGCNTPVVQNGLDGEWIARPAPERPKRYAFFTVEPPDPDASDAERPPRRCSTTAAAATGPTIRLGSSATTWSAPSRA